MSWFTDVVRFHHKMKRPIGEGFGTKVLRRRRKLINEEFNEVCKAMRELEYANWHYRGWPPSQVVAQREVVAELVDLLYVTVGTFVELGIDPQPVWKAIHDANMEKMPDPSGGDKSVKPKGWKKPTFALRSFAGVIPLIVGSNRNREVMSYERGLDRTDAVRAPRLAGDTTTPSECRPLSQNRLDRDGLARP